MSNPPMQQQLPLQYGQNYQQQHQHDIYQEHPHNYIRHPPQYRYNAGGAPSVPIDSKPTFEQTFEQYYEKPGWNDVWAGVLARRHILVYLII